MSTFSLILAVAATLTAAGGGGLEPSASRQPLAILIQGGATLKDDVLGLHGPWKGRPEDLHLLGDLPDRIEVEVWGWSLPDDGLKHLRGAKLKRYRLSLREGDAGMECLRQCGRIEEIVICRSTSPPPPEDWAVCLEDTLAQLNGIPGLRKLTVCWYQPLTTAEMARMGELTGLEEVNLDFWPITREAFAQLTGLIRLKKLVLDDLTESTAAGLVGLAGLPSLESVSLPFPVNETALVGLKHLPRLKSLDAEFPWMTDVGVEHLADLATLESLHLQIRNLDADLSPLGRLSNLRSLSFVGAAKTDADVACLGELANLESLDLSWTKVTDVELAHLARLSKLKSLKFAWGNVSDAGIEQIAKLADLESLVLSSDDRFNPSLPRPRYVTDAGLSHLARLSKLKSLSLARSLRVTDAGIAHLANLANLEALDLSAARVSDPGIAHLANLTNLETLDLSFTRVTDAGLSHLARLSKLKSLNLDGTNVTDAGVACLASLVDPASLDASSAAAAGSGTPRPALSNLEFLSLRRTKVVGTRLQNLAILPKLESLQVSGQELTDAAIEQIAGLHNLRTLWVGGPLVTHGGLMRLTQLPRLEQLAITANTPVTTLSVEAFEAARTAELPYVEIRLGVSDGTGLGAIPLK